MARCGITETFVLTGGQTILPGFDGEVGDRIDIDMAAYGLSSREDVGYRLEAGEMFLFNRRTGRVVVRYPTEADGFFHPAAVRLTDAAGEENPLIEPVTRAGTVKEFDLCAGRGG